jgi:heme/copper-type cytochrome/quinol oxidase subunit 1
MNNQNHNNKIYYWASRSLFSTNHKDIGTLYLLFGALSAVAGTTLSILIRIELNSPTQQALLNDHSLYNVIVTNHAFVIIFFTLIPALVGGLSNRLVPSLVNSSMAFPKVNNLAFWLVPSALLLLMLSIIVQNGTGAGRTVYPPLSSSIGHSGPSLDLAVLSLHVLGTSYILGAINFITTIFNMRAPGVTMRRLSFSVWVVLIMEFLILISLPSIFKKTTLILIDINKTLFHFKVEEVNSTTWLMKIITDSHDYLLLILVFLTFFIIFVGTCIYDYKINGDNVFEEVFAVIILFLYFSLVTIYLITSTFYSILLYLRDRVDEYIKK